MPASSRRESWVVTSGDQGHALALERVAPPGAGSKPSWTTAPVP